jgi:hypothetical protein
MKRRFIPSFNLVSPFSDRRKIVEVRIGIAGRRFAGPVNSHNAQRFKIPQGFRDCWTRQAGPLANRGASRKTLASLVGVHLQNHIDGQGVASPTRVHVLKSFLYQCLVYLEPGIRQREVSSSHPHESGDLALLTCRTL